jgi:hypothetical protein
MSGLHVTYTYLPFIVFISHVHFFFTFALNFASCVFRFEQDDKVGWRRICPNLPTCNLRVVVMWRN